MPAPNTTPILTPTAQLLTGVIFAESATKNWGGGENADEKVAIGATFLNEAYYAAFKPSPHKRCYNSNFGVGTLQSAIKLNSVAYLKERWNKVMIGDLLKPSSEWSKLPPDDADHLRLSIAAAASIVTAAPISLATLGGKAPVAFNKAANQPPNPKRMQKIAHLGASTFYGFLPGRECD